MNENAARVDWAGVGVRVPRRLVSPTTVRLAVTRALVDRRLRARAGSLAAWAGDHDPGARAATLVEELAARR
jgi:UDP:flavonoid glycosyltransferase YjiC (YdhE family)